MFVNLVAKGGELEVALNPMSSNFQGITK